jgi:hypothetical protein
MDIYNNVSTNNIHLVIYICIILDVNLQIYTLLI